jgi:hypothetical protein
MRDRRGQVQKIECDPSVGAFSRSASRESAKGSISTFGISVPHTWRGARVRVSLLN